MLFKIQFLRLVGLTAHSICLHSIRMSLYVLISALKTIIQRLSYVSALFQQLRKFTEFSFKWMVS